MPRRRGISGLDFAAFSPPILLFAGLFCSGGDT
jgi:hypothetical protein